ncbi:MAG TPA: carbonic anhydrase family protein [Flavisolibacter sp.]|nr:carbonic anhydrase family protein [Flavisolibacter sp.]
MRTFNKELQQNLSPAQALEILKEGNNRFVNNSRESRDLLQQVQATKEGQWPFAVILSCIDSRTSSELVFDLGIGDAFNARIAGNIVNEDILGSMEFACKVAGSKLIVVLGHTKCGAVKGACDHVQLGNLTSLINKLEPAVAEEKSVSENRSSSNPEFVEKVAEINVKRNIQEILNRSEILKDMVEKGEIGIIGGMHDITTGVVEFYNDTAIIKDSKQLQAQEA